MEPAAAGETTPASSSKAAKDVKRKASTSAPSTALGSEREEKRAKREETSVTSPTTSSQKERIANGAVAADTEDGDTASTWRNKRPEASRSDSPKPTSDKRNATDSRSESQQRPKAKEKDSKSKKSSKSGENGSSSSRKGDTKKDSGKEQADAAIAEEDEKPLRENAITKDETTVLTGHTAEVFVSAWNPTVPTMLASGAGDATVRIWDLPANPGDPVESPAVCKHLPAAHSKDIATLHWNPDGTLLASGSHDGILRLWTPQGDLHLVMSMHQGAILSVRWNRKGNMLLSASADGTVIVWDLGSGKTRQQFAFHSDNVLDADWLTTAEGSIGSEPGSSLPPPMPHGLSPSVADTIFASCSADNSIVICKLGETRPVKSFKGHTDEVNAIRFDPSQTLIASVSDDCTAKIWALDLDSSGKAVSSNHHSGSSAGTAGGEGARKRGARGRIGSANTDGMDVDEDTGSRADDSADKEREKDNRGTPSSLGTSNGGAANAGKEATAGASSAADAAAGSAGTGAGTSTQASKDGSSSAVVTTAKGPNKGLRLTLSGHTKELYALAWCPTGPGSKNPDQPRMLATTAFDWTCRLWNGDNGDCIRVIDAHKDNVLTLCFSPCARFLATGALDKKVLVSRVEVSVLFSRSLMTLNRKLTHYLSLLTVLVNAGWRSGQAVRRHRASLRSLVEEQWRLARSPACRVARGPQGRGASSQPARQGGSQDVLHCEEVMHERMSIDFCLSSFGTSVPFDISWCPLFGTVFQLRSLS